MAASSPGAEAADNEQHRKHRKKGSSRPAAVVAPFRSVVLVVHVCPKTDLEEEVVEEVVVRKAGPKTAVAKARAPMALVATAGAQLRYQNQLAAVYSTQAG